MIYLLLAILCSAMISILLRISSGKIKEGCSMLAFNYLACTVLGMVYAGFTPGITRNPGFPAALGLGVVNGMGDGTFAPDSPLTREQAVTMLGRVYELVLTSAISGGELQLALIARAIAQQAKILVMDEPSASLDYGNKLRVMETVKGLTREGYTVIQSTHDPDQAYLYSDQILALYGGQILADGTPRETISSQLISTLYSVDVEVCSMHRDDVRVCIPAHLTK